MNIDLRLTGDLDTMTPAQRSAVAALFGSTALSTPSAGTPSADTPVTTPASGTAPAAAAPAVDYFPVNAGDAPFPSPENSRSVRVGDEVQGKPYLIDKDGSIYRLEPLPADSDYAGPYASSDAWPSRGVSVNGALCRHYDRNEVFMSLIVRAGQVWGQIRGGQWHYFQAAMGGWYNGGLPAAVDPNAPPASSAPAATARPVPTGPAPGSSSTVLLVGPGRPFADLAAAFAAAHDGDTVDVDGTYTTAPPRVEKNLLIRSATGATWNLKGVTDGWASGGKGAFVPTASQVVFDGLTVLDAVGPDSGFGAFRADDSCKAMTVRNSTIVRCTNGIKGSGGPGCIITEEGNHFDGNGLGPDPDHCHQIYTHETDFTSCKGSAFVNCAGGHDIKARGPTLSVDGCKVSSGRGSCIEAPNGSAELVVIQNTKFSKAADAENHLVVGYAPEGALRGSAGMLLLNNDYDLQCPNPLIQCEAGVVTITGGTRSGNPMASQGGGKVVGL